MYTWIYIYIYIAVLENPLTRMADITFTPPVHLPYAPQLEKYLQFLKKPRWARSACLSASAVTFRNL